MTRKAREGALSFSPIQKTGIKGTTSRPKYILLFGYVDSVARREEEERLQWLSVLGWGLWSSGYLGASQGKYVDGACME